jgi:hypothetical protein
MLSAVARRPSARGTLRVRGDRFVSAVPSADFRAGVSRADRFVAAADCTAGLRATDRPVPLTFDFGLAFNCDRDCGFGFDFD